MKYYIIAGEASGDLHGSNLIYELQKKDTSADIRCWGGDKMKDTGATLIKHYRELAFMGFVEVIKNIGTILQNLKFCKEDIESFKPDVVVLVDYPGFNLRIAEWASLHGYKVVYYISPQVWAWKENRVKKIIRFVDKMLVILPFEKEFYQKWNYNVEYVGHPLVEVVDRFRNDHPNLVNTNSRIIALLPGSRKQEIFKKLPVMLEVAARFPAYKFIVAKAPGLEDQFYEPFFQPYTNVDSVRDQTYQLLMQSRAAIVTSGTATLETALFQIPQVVCYKGSAISYQIAKRLIKIKYISLVNLIMNKEVVKELIQDEMNVENIVKEMENILNDDGRIARIKQDYWSLREILLKGGNASAKAAESIYRFVSAAAAVPE